MRIKGLLTVVLLILLNSAVFAQSKIVVSGKVVDEKGQPLIGAVVGIKGQNGAYTGSSVSDMDGKYSISCLPDDTLEAMFMGYKPRQEKVSNRMKLDFVLEPDSVQLEETVVIGYGSVKKEDLTGSVSNVKMADVRDMPVASVDEALQGRVAGADIMTTTGEPGATTSIRIRGTRSISASNEPLIVVDGVMDAVSDINDINPADIESISVLKDASSTAIYGSRGSNGVIIITTKASSSPKAPRPTINFKAEAGISQLPRTLDIMNAAEFSLYRNQYELNRSSELTYHSPVSMQQTPDPFSKGTGTDWVKEMVRIAPYQNYFLSMYGGNGKFSYYFSLGYNDNKGIIRNSGDRKITGTASIAYKFTKWFKMGYKLNFVYRNTDETLASIGGTSWWNAGIYLSPLITPQDNFNPLYNLGQPINTPTALIDNNIYYTDRKSYRQTVSADFQIVKDLKWANSFSYYTYQRHTYRYYPSTLPVKVEGEGGDAYRSEGEQVSYNVESTLNYAKDFSKRHHVDATLGFTYSNFHNNEFGLSGSGYMIDANMWHNMGAIQNKELFSASSGYTDVKRASVLGRANYNYKQKYYLTFSGRFDGASNFAANRKWGFFPSGALKWNIARERFMRRTHDIDELSLKVSAGLTGNDALSSYASLASMTSTTGGYLFNDTQPVAVYPSRLDSPDLSWEKTFLGNVALTGAFFNNRLNVNLEGYYSKTTDLLLSVKTPIQTGYSSRYANLGATTNTGVELSIESRNIVKRNFTWSTNFTISHNKQRVLDVGTEDFVSVYNSPGNNPYMMYGYVKGYPLNSLWGFQYAGVWHNDGEVQRNAATRAYVSQTALQQPGLPKYVDVNHDGTLNQDDLCYLGNADPVIYGGLQNNFFFYGFKLGVYFTYSLGGKIYNYSELFMAGGRMTNQYRYMLDAWTPYNAESDYPAAGYSYDSLVPSSFMVHDASYIRLQNVSLAYTFNIKKKWMRELTIGVSGSNLYLWKKYNGYDPDVSTSSGGSTIRRMDLGAYPRARRVVFNLAIKF